MNKIDMLLIFPPCWDIASPYSALPYIKGFANSLGYDIAIYDDNISFFDHIFSNSYLGPSIEFALTSFHKMQKGILPFEMETFNKLRRIHIYSNDLLKVDEYKNILRTNPDRTCAQYVYRILDAALEAIRYQKGIEIWWSTCSSDKYDISTIGGIEEFLGDNKHNIFFDYYTAGPGKVLVEKALTYKELGLSITSSSQLVPGLTFASLIKKKNKNIIIHFGGGYITNLSQSSVPDETLSNILKIPDYFICFDGETALEKRWSGTPFSECPNIIYRNGNKLIRTETLPCRDQKFIVPNFDGFPLDKYFIGRLVLPVQSAIGCYNKCAFCTLPYIHSLHKYRQFKIDDIGKGIRYLKEKYNTPYFMFTDSVVNLNRVIDLAKVLKDVGISWTALTRFDKVLSDEEYQIIIEGGCKQLRFGLESYNQRILGLMHKNTNLETIDKIIAGSLKNKLSIILFIFFGFPGETKEEMETTKKFILTVSQKIKSLNMSYGGVSYGYFLLRDPSEVYRNPDKFGIEIIPNSEGTVSLEYQYKTKYGVTREEALNTIKSLSLPQPLEFSNFVPRSYVIFNDKPSHTVPVDDKIFCDEFDLDGKKKTFRYLFNYEKQLVVPLENKAIEDDLICVYGHKKRLPFDEKKKYCVNPFLQIDTIVKDSLKKKQYRLSFDLLKILNENRFENEDPDTLKQLYDAGFIIIKNEIVDERKVTL